jgi:coniferyl-alcohol glucosyltransferase
VDISDKIQPNAKKFTRLTAVMTEIRPTLRSSISSLKLSPTADEFHMLKYVFVSSAWPLALMLYAPVLDKKVQGEYVVQKEPLRLPGCMPVRPEDVVDPLLDRTMGEYRVFLRVGLEM